MKKTNVIIYTILFTLLFIFITELLIYNYGAGLLINSITNYPLGGSVIGQSLLTVIILIVMLLFKNSYVFTQKKQPISKGLYYGLFYIIISIFYFLIYGGVAIVSNGGFPLLNLMLLCLLIGISEEFLCRGWLLNEFLERFGKTKKGVWYSIVVSGLIFGFMHLANIYFGNQDLYATLSQCINASAIGIMFGVIYYKTKNIWSVILLHAIYDFSLMLTEVLPVTSATEIQFSVSIVTIAIELLIAFVQLLNLTPYIDNVNKEPQKKKVIFIALITSVLYLGLNIFLNLMQIKLGNTYTYDEICINNYSLTYPNYNYYKMNYLTSDNSYNYQVYVNEKQNIVVENVNSEKQVEIKVKNLYDYIVLEQNDYYVLAYVESLDSLSTYIYYIYLPKTSMNNSNDYLNYIKNNMSKYLLPSPMQLAIITDYDSKKSYITAYDVDKGHYLLTSKNKMSLLTN